MAMVAGEDIRAASTYVPPQATGRRIVQFAAGVSETDQRALLTSVVGEERLVAPAGPQAVAAATAAFDAAGGALYLSKLGLAIVGGNAQESMAYAEALGGHAEVSDTRPEFWMFTADTGWFDDAQSTWGLAAIGATKSAFDGSGIRLAVLDTGFDLQHPDFVGRVIVAESFVDGQTVHDVRGHGTHCAGTAAGPRAASGNRPGYGVASGALLHIGKVLGDNGAGREGDIIAGMDWALELECEIISMSLRRPVLPTEPHDPIYERIGLRALEAGCLIIAAAGNDSDRRYGYRAPVGAPANAPSIMAVAAVDGQGAVASFSNAGVGQAAVDIAAPGVGVFSAFPRPQLYDRASGTSMACPHVAGAAALWAQSDPNLRGKSLWTKLVETAQPLGDSTVDIGAGLVSCP